MKKEYQDAAKRLGFPYWDWGSIETQLHGVPEILTLEELDGIVTPPDFSPKTLVNPLRAFTLPRDVGSTIASGDRYNPSQKPNYKVPLERTPYTPKGYATVRHPNSAYETQDDVLHDTVKEQCR